MAAGVSIRAFRSGHGTKRGAICSPSVRTASPVDPDVPSFALTRQETDMLKFIGGTIGAIFLIGLIVVVLFFKLIF